MDHFGTYHLVGGPASPSCEPSASRVIDAISYIYGSTHRPRRRGNIRDEALENHGVDSLGHPGVPGPAGLDLPLTTELIDDDT